MKVSGWVSLFSIAASLTLGSACGEEDRFSEALDPNIEVQPSPR